MSSKKINFQFTRHLLSCNNVNEGRTFGKDYEPGGTMYGIFETIKYAQLEEQKKYFKFNHVYVSNLHRTWITAFLLYATNLSPTDTLNIYICPFLKEKKHYGIIKHGNFPQPIYRMANKFLNFFKNIHKLCVEEENIEEINKLYTSKNRKIWYRSLPSTIVLILPPNKAGKIQKIIYKKQSNKPNSCFELISFCKIEDTAGPSSGSEFTNDGDLQKFMEWYNSLSNYYGKHTVKKDKQNIVNVVSHSKVMSGYLKKFRTKDDLVFNIDDDRIGLTDIRNSNTWHFNTTENKITQGTKSIPYLVNDFDMKKGVPNKEIRKMAKNIEKSSKKYSLCGEKKDVISANEVCDITKKKPIIIHRNQKKIKNRNNISRKTIKRK